MPRPWYFPVTRSYWCGHRVKDPMEGDNSYDINHVYEMDASQKGEHLSLLAYEETTCICKYARKQCNQKNASMKRSERHS